MGAGQVVLGQVLSLFVLFLVLGKSYAFSPAKLRPALHGGFISSLATKAGLSTSPTDGMTNSTLIVEGDTEKVQSVSPALSFDKYLTMQVGDSKRVVATICYSERNPGLKPFYLTVAKRIKETYPDVVIDKRVVPSIEDEFDGMGGVFEVLVDGKVVVGKAQSKKQSVRHSGTPSPGDMAGGRSVYVSMTDLDLAIAKARRRRRPSTLYAPDDLAVVGTGGSSDDADAIKAAAMKLEKMRRNKEKGEVQGRQDELGEKPNWND